MLFNKLNKQVLVGGLAMLFTQSIAFAAEDRPALAYTNAPVAKPLVKSSKAKSVKSDSSKDEVKFQAPRPGEITVSDRAFNRFVFPSPVTQLVFPAGVPLMGKPIYLAGNTQVLLQFQRGSDTPVQAVIEVEGGQVYTLTLNPRPIDGVTQRIDGARDKSVATSKTKEASAGTAGTSGAPRGEDIDLLKRVVDNDIPSGYESVKLPKPTRFDKFTVVPLAAWSDGTSRRIMVFSLVAVPGQTAVVAPPQFYRAGINAVLIDGDVVDANNSPNLYVVEETQDE